MPIKIFVVLITCVILAAVIDFIRREKMTFKYSVNWFFGCAVVLFFACNDQLLLKVSQWAGFSLPSNFIFFMLMIFVMFLSLLLTLYINEQNSRTEALAQAVANLENQIKKLQQNNR